VTLPELGLAPDTDVFVGSGQLITLKSGDFEEGISVVKGSLKQFFVLPARKTFSLRFQVSLWKEENRKGENLFCLFIYIISLFLLIICAGGRNGKSRIRQSAKQIVAI
jgi:hypothetical protein